MTDEIRRQVCVGAGVAATVLVDGSVAATWTIEDDAVLTIEAFRRLPDRAGVEAERLRLLAFVAPGADHDIRFMVAGRP